jgi:hypothetical protein
MKAAEPLPLEQTILDLLRSQWARAHATQAYIDGAVVEARIVVTAQSVRVEVQTRCSRTIEPTGA